MVVEVYKGFDVDAVTLGNRVFEQRCNTQVITFVFLDTLTKILVKFFIIRTVLTNSSSATSPCTAALVRIFGPTTTRIGSEAVLVKSMIEDGVEGVRLDALTGLQWILNWSARENLCTVDIASIRFRDKACTCHLVELCAFCTLISSFNVDDFWVQFERRIVTCVWEAIGTQVVVEDFVEVF